MSEEVKQSATPQRTERIDSAKLLKQLHDEILAHINLQDSKKFDELIVKMSSIHAS